MWYKERELRIEYPWHPLFGRVLRARDGGRRQGAGSILVENRPGFFRTLPPWMCDPAYCARLDSGPPLVALAALETLARTLLMRYSAGGHIFCHRSKRQCQNARTCRSMLCGGGKKSKQGEIRYDYQVSYVRQAGRSALSTSWMNTAENALRYV